MLLATIATLEGATNHDTQCNSNTAGYEHEHKQEHGHSRCQSTMASCYAQVGTHRCLTLGTDAVTLGADVLNDIGGQGDQFGTVHACFRNISWA